MFPATAFRSSQTTSSARLSDWHPTFKRIVLEAWRPYLWLTLALLLLYGYSLAFTEFTHQDDYYLIVESHPLLRDPNHLWKAFREDVYHQHQGGNLYRPLLTLSFMLDTAISGTSLISYRVSNIVFHTVSVFLLFLFLQTLGFSRTSAFVAAAFFGIHPALTQAVAWIPGRNDSLLAIFALATLLALHNYNKTGQVRWVAVHILCFSLAMFTKETALVLPLFCALLFWNNDQRDERWTARIVLLVSWLAVVLVWVSLRHAAMLAPVGPGDHIVTSIFRSFWVVFAYLGSILLPSELFVVTVAEDLSVYAGATGLIGLLLLGFRSGETNWKLFFLGLLWFLVFLVPTFYQQPDVTVPIRYFQHRLYVPSIGMTFMILSLSSWKIPERWRRAVTAVVAVSMLGAGGLAVRQLLLFQNAMTFSSAIAHTSPHNPFVHNDINMMKHTEAALMPSRQQRRLALSPASYRITLAQSAERLQQAIAADPHNPSYHHHLAVVYFGLGLLVEAEKHLQQSLTLDPTNALAYYNAGVLYYRGHRPSDAEASWRNALKLDTSLADAHRNLCYLYYSWKQFARAREHAERARQWGAEIPAELLKELEQKIDADNR